MTPLSSLHLPWASLLFRSWQVLHEPLIDEDPVFIATCTERELRKRKKRKFSLWVRQCSSTGFIIQVSLGMGPGRPGDGTREARRGDSFRN